ncbi:cupin domain-containing protein [Alteromonas antoniana]|uniref:cupin domain-containing protein n=1 Tax=Alteromonas antoniana TaxID=2803813 RepID=UPI001C45388B|nr:cupin domain-containing protein [Alteromonas antoniana]
MKVKSILFLLCSGLVATVATAQQIDTSVVTRADTVADKGEGWVFYSYFTGESYGVEKTLTGMAVIQPGYEIHPPHVHADEEYLVITQGEGEWSVKGETFKASTGDMLYASPWDEHGVKNTGDEPLVFVVFKWHSKNNTVPLEPESAKRH